MCRATTKLLDINLRLRLVRAKLKKATLHNYFSAKLLLHRYFLRLVKILYKKNKLEKIKNR